MTVGTYNFVSIMASFACIGALISGRLPWAPAAGVAVSVITYSSDHVKIRFTSQLIIGIPNVLQKLLKHFNRTANSTSFVLASAAVFPVMFVLYLKI